MAAVRKYSSWSLDRLRSEKEKIDKAIEEKEGQGRSDALRAIKAAVKKSGFELAELIDDLRDGGEKKRGPGRPAGKKGAAKKKARGKKRGSTGKVPPKYRNPKDSSMTWTGRGRAPLWVQEHEKKHGNRNALLIK